MGKVFRVLCGLIVFILAGASCATGPQTKAPVSSKKPMVVVTIDPETGSVVAVKDDSGRDLRIAGANETKVGTLTTPTPVTITVELQPVAPTTSPTTSSSETGATSTASALTTYTCKLVIVNGVLRCM
jgi:hypothetical protein